jgi:hypothetical protein
MTLLAMLLIAFTLLPYQTSMLVNALSETSVYQSAHYSHTIRGHHIVVTGHLTADSAESIVEQVFHPDSGFSDYNLVFLHPGPPTDAMKRLLKTSQHSHRLLYLQGSWASQKVLGAYVQGGWYSAVVPMLKQLQGSGLMLLAARHCTVPHVLVVCVAGVLLNVRACTIRHRLVA